MKLLILGGTAFLGKEIARQAVAAGHQVTCATRGTSGEPPAGATFVHVDRSTPEGLSNLEGAFDAVIDVARHPSQVRNALAALAGRVGHVSFVSSCSAYADEATPGQIAATAPLKDAAPPDDDETDPQWYGNRKVTCEQLFAETGLPLFINRAGLIVGPEDPSGRFTYWPARLARAGETIAPGSPADSVQWIDVRDLAAWHVHAAETGLTGTFDGIGRPVTRSSFLDGVAAGVGADPTFTWIDQEFLTTHEVAPWTGERSLPMWLPLPDYAGFMSHDTSPALAAGLTQRPVADTARDTLAWLTANPDQARPVGLTPEAEAEVLTAWHAR